MVYKEFIKKIIHGIKQKKLTLKKVAKYSGIDVSYLSRIIAGKRNPPYDEDTIKKIAKILGIDEDELIFSAGRIPHKYQQYFCNKTDIESIIALLKNKQNQQQVNQHWILQNKKEYKVKLTIKQSSTPEELL